MLELRPEKIISEGTIATGDWSTSVALPGVAAAVAAGANCVYLQAEGANGRYTRKATEVTSTTGLVLYDSDPPLRLTQDLADIRVLRVLSGAVLHYVYVYDPNVRLNG